MDEQNKSKTHSEKLRHGMKIGFVFILSVLDGMVESSYGPSVKDYQCIFQETRQRISLLYPTFGTFKAIGTLLYFLLRHRVDSYLVATVCMIITCLLLVSLPLLPVLWLALLLTAVIGLAAGIASHSRLDETGRLAAGNAVPVHLFPLGLSTGSFIGPLLISPFLGENQPPVSNRCNGNMIDCDSPSILINNNSRNGTGSHECESFQSNIMFGFLIFLGLGVAMVFINIVFRNIFQTKSSKNNNEKTEDDKPKKIEIIDFIFLILLGFIAIIGAPTNFIYGSLLSTFGINSSLKISPRVMSFMTSSFFATTLFGRIVGTCLSLVVSQLALLTVCMIGSTAAAVGLIFLSETSIESLWAATSVFAFLYSPLFGAVIAWSGEVARTKHVLYGLIIVTDLAGLSLMSFLIGQLMNNVDMDFLNYSMLASCGLQVVILLMLYVLSKFLKYLLQKTSPKQQTNAVFESTRL